MTVKNCFACFALCAIRTRRQFLNRARLKVWEVQPEGFLREAFIDVDGTIAGTCGECKQGIGLSYKGIWAYAPLLVSLANTKEVLYLGELPEGPNALVLRQQKSTTTNARRAVNAGFRLSVVASVPVRRCLT